MAEERWVMCGLCDTAYDPNGDDAKVHEHPEPQSGEPRDAWLASRLKYSDWIVSTDEGRAWAERDRTSNSISRYYRHRLTVGIEGAE